MPKSTIERAPLASIIIPCWNGVRYTRECLASVERFTPEPHEIILIDNGSTDGTASFAERRRRLPGSALSVVRNRKNLGFAAAINQGSARARGRYVVWLNNDAVVTAGWLREMIACAESSRRIGAVGPCTNAIAGGGVQQIADGAYRGARGLRLFAAAWGLGPGPRTEKVKALAGFCLLVKRAAMRRTGPLDARFELGCYEDMDYSLRLRNAGYGLRLARRAFVHHYGHRAFTGNAVPSRNARKNLRRFLEKWGTPGLDRLGYRPRP